jgi:hypothetical protein
MLRQVPEVSGLFKLFQMTLLFRIVLGTVFRTASLAGVGTTGAAPYRVKTG